MDGTRRNCYRSDDIIAPVGLDVCDGDHGLGVMKEADQGASDFSGNVPSAHPAIEWGTRPGGD